MIDKYLALKNTTNWIENSSLEEFMSTFHELGDEYDGITLGEYIDLFIDTDLNDDIEFNILTTDNFIFGAESKLTGANIALEPCLIEEPSIERVYSIELDAKLTDSYNASNDEIYDFSCAA